MTGSLTLRAKANIFPPSVGGRSSAWLEPQIVDLAVAGSNPVGHPIASMAPELPLAQIGYRNCKPFDQVGVVGEFADPDNDRARRAGDQTAEVRKNRWR